MYIYIYTYIHVYIYLDICVYVFPIEINKTEKINLFKLINVLMILCLSIDLFILNSKTH